MSDIILRFYIYRGVWSSRRCIRTGKDKKQEQPSKRSMLLEWTVFQKSEILLARILPRTKVRKMMTNLPGAAQVSTPKGRAGVSGPLQSRDGVFPPNSTGFVSH